MIFSNPGRAAPRLFFSGTLMKSIIAFLQRSENFCIAVCFIVMCLAEFAQVVNRNLIGAGISWFDELARYCMVYMTLLATEAGLRDGSQIAVTALTDKMPPFVRWILRLLVKVVIVGFSILVLNDSIGMLQMQLENGQVSAGLGIPMWVPYAILPLAFGAIAIVQTVSFITLLIKGRSDNTNARSQEDEKI